MQWVRHTLFLTNLLKEYQENTKLESDVDKG